MPDGPNKENSQPEWMNQFPMPQSMGSRRFQEWVQGLELTEQQRVRQEATDFALQYARAHTPPDTLAFKLHMRNAPSPAEEMARLNRMTEADLAQQRAEIKTFEQNDVDLAQRVINLSEWRRRKNKGDNS